MESFNYKENGRGEANELSHLFYDKLSAEKGPIFEISVRFRPEPVNETGQNRVSSRRFRVPNR